MVVTDVVDDAGNGTVAAVRAAGGDATYVRADVSKWADCEAMVKCATDTYGGLHVLYNNAGIFPADDGGVLDTPESTWEKVMEINLKGVWLGCRAGIPAMIASGGGSIVNVASFVALMGAATAQIAYTASKGGVLSMTREIAVEYATAGHPGELALPRTDSNAPARGAPLRSRPPRPAHGAHPDGPARARRGVGEGRALPRLRRRLVHDRAASSSSTAASPRLRHSGVKASRPSK